MKVAVYQMDPIIGDLKGNSKKILEAYKKGVQEGAELVITPELSLVGYSPQDLIEKKEFRKRTIQAAEEIAAQTGDVGLIFGSITEDFDDIGTDIFNSAILCYNGKIQFIQNKTLIPNYDVFDEVRYFESAADVYIHEFKGEKLGISICEDIWNDSDYWNKRRYTKDPVNKLVQLGSSFLINISASPYAYGKREERREMLSTLTKADKQPLIYCCCVGAQTDLIFDGGSMVLDNNGNVIKLGKFFEEDFFIVDTKDSSLNAITNVERSFEEEAIEALTLGIKDYCKKINVEKVIVGLSGGIDSAVVIALAARALGPENVRAVMMPSKFSSEGSVTDSEKLIKNLGISSAKIAINPIFEKSLETLQPAFKGLPENIAEENIQARIRGMLLMALSNKFNYLLLTTGNKSEIATGYATLYGDMCGALAVIGDAYKTEVYKIAKFLNREKEIIPEEIISKPPSAELRENQKDQDSLPPYEILDAILKAYLEENKEFHEIVEMGLEPETVKKTLSLVDHNEFKRKQAAPTLRISTKAFGYGRRYPIVQRWRKNVE